MKKKCSFILISVLFVCYLNSTTVIQEQQYKLSSVDTEETARKVALEKLRYLVFDVFGYNIFYLTKLENPSVHKKLKFYTKPTIGVLLKDELSVKILEQNLEGEIISLKVELNFEDEEVLKNISGLIDDSAKLRQSREIIQLYKSLIAGIEKVQTQVEDPQVRKSRKEFEAEYRGLIEKCEAAEWFEQSRIDLEMNEYQRQQEIFSKLKKLDPSSGKNLQDNIWEKAFNDNDSAAENNVSNRKKLEFSSLSEETEYYKSIIRNDTENFVAYNKLGLVYIKQNEFSEAINSFKKAIDINRDFSSGYNNLGIVYMRISKLNKAIGCFKDAIYIDRNFHNAYNNLGVCYLKKKDYESAISNFLTAAELDPQNSNYFYNLGYVYSRFDEFELTEKYYLESIRIDPRNVKSLFNLAIVYDDNGKKQEAIEYYHRILNLTPHNFKTLYNLGVLYSDLENYEKAAEFYLKAIESDPNNAKTYFNLSIIYGKMGDINKDIEYTKKAADLGYEPAREYLIKYNKRKEKYKIE